MIDTDQELSKSARRRLARKPEAKRGGPILSRRDFLKTVLTTVTATAAIFGGKKIIDYLSDTRFLDRLRDYQKGLDVPVFSLSLEQQAAVRSEGWFEQVPLGLPDDYQSLNLDAKFAAIQAATIEAQNELGNRMIRSASPHFVYWAKTLNDNFSAVESPIPKDGSIVLRVGPFQADLTEEGVIYDIFFDTDAVSGQEKIFLLITQPGLLAL